MSPGHWEPLQSLSIRSKAVQPLQGLTEQSWINFLKHWGTQTFTLITS